MWYNIITVKITITKTKGIDFMTTMVRTIYVAFDGKMFITEKECKEYENEHKWERWVDLYYKRFLNQMKVWESKKIDNISNEVDDILLYNNTIAIYTNSKEGVITITNLKTGRIGKSLCTNNKYFSHKVGYAVAFARYLGEEVPR
jgi:hypothetical protein